VGGALFKLVPPAAIRYGAGAVFIAVGLWVMVKG
jgi:hypothetical protein